MFEYEESAYGDNRSIEDVIRAFIGRKEPVMYPKLGLSSFNPFAFLFPIYYFIFRKCYISGIIAYGITFALETLPVDYSIYRILILIFKVAAGALFYKIYQWEIMRRIDKWTAEDKSYKEMETLASLKGGTNILAVVIVVAVEMIVSYIFYALILGAAGYSIYDAITI